MFTVIKLALCSLHAPSALSCILTSRLRLSNSLKCYLSLQALWKNAAIFQTLLSLIFATEEVSSVNSHVGFITNNPSWPPIYANHLGRFSGGFSPKVNYCENNEIYSLWRLPSITCLLLSLNLWYINPKSSCGPSDSFLLRSKNRCSSEIVRSLRISRAHLCIIRGWRFAMVLQVQTPGESGARVCADTVYDCVFRPQPRWATVSSSHLAELRTDRKAIKASHLCSQLIIDTTNHH